MRKVTLMIGLASVLMTTTVSAQTLTAVEAVALIKGKTTYMELTDSPRGKGATVIFYADDNKAVAKFPNGSAPKGVWSVKGDEICVAFEDQPSSACSIYVKVGDKYDVVNVATKKVRGTIQKLVPGNAEKL